MNEIGIPNDIEQLWKIIEQSITESAKNCPKKAEKERLTYGSMRMQTVIAETEHKDPEESYVIHMTD